MKKGQRAGAGKWQRLELDLPKIGAIFREAGFAVEEADPIEGYALRDRAGRFRRLHARYPEGWRATLVMHVNGSQSLSYALRIVTPERSAA